LNVSVNETKIVFNINIFSQLSVPELGKQTLLSSQVLMPDSHACPHGPENQTWRKPDMEKPVVELVATVE